MNSVSTVKEACCGCGACKAACPKGAIALSPNACGFTYPSVDENLCVSCGMCLKTCPAVADAPSATPKKVYAARARDQGILTQSSSGGLFTLAARAVLGEGGAVFGCALDKNAWRANIISAAGEDGLVAMRGSKYVQSDMEGVFISVKDLLKQGKPVLFTGCPCQVAAVRLFLGGGQDGLYTADILCHGVPSPLLFETYIHSLEAREGEKILDYRFRTKDRGWGKCLSYTTKKGVRIRNSMFDPYYHCFMKGETCRESCYNCRYANQSRVGDLTFGDYWGIIKEHSSFYSEKGVSALLVNTPKGEKLLNSMLDGVEIIESSLERVSRHNVNLVRPTSRPPKRDGIYDGINELSAAEYVKKRLTVNNSLPALVGALTPWRFKKLYQIIRGGR